MLPQAEIDSDLNSDAGNTPKSKRPSITPRRFQSNAMDSPGADSSDDEDRRPSHILGLVTDPPSSSLMPPPPPPLGANYQEINLQLGSGNSIEYVLNPSDGAIASSSTSASIGPVVVEESFQNETARSGHQLIIIPFVVIILESSVLVVFQYKINDTIFQVLKTG